MHRGMEAGAVLIIGLYFIYLQLMFINYSNNYSNSKPCEVDEYIIFSGTVSVSYCHAVCRLAYFGLRM